MDADATGEQVAQLLVSEGLLSEERARYARRVKEKLGEDHPLLKVLLDLGDTTESLLRATLRKHRAALPLGGLLVQLGYLQPKDLRLALQAQQDPQSHGKRLGEILVEKHLLHEHQLIEVLADQLGFSNVDLKFEDIDPDLLAMVKPDWCRHHQALPLRREGQKVAVAFYNPLDQAARESAATVFGATVEPLIATHRAIEEAIKSFELGRKHTGVRLEVNESQATTLADSLIREALEMQASDIHIEPMRNVVRVRVRRDGILMLHRELEPQLAPALTSRLKILAKADIAEKRRHQGGGFLFDDPQSGRRCDVRASFYATIFGEKIVLRLLARKAELLDIREVGMAPKMLDRFLDDAMDIPSGVVLITGPTGSGKTTTLYACVNYLNNIERSIITAEDPVEYVVDGIGQCSLNPKINVTFEETLRHMVRQDPDVIVLGEVRDHYSAEAAVQAALTGHKVLTTFHTEDTIGGLLRLMNMEIETFLISSTVVSVVAQRLLRRVCPHCAESYHPNTRELQRLGYIQAQLRGAEFRTGRGCERCYYSGYLGRVGVFELLVLNEPVKEAILEKRTSSEIRRIGVETSGLITLMEDGIAKAAQGLTTIEEILRQLPRLGKPRSLADIVRIAGIAAP